jgi:hypothetical protein
MPYSTRWEVRIARSIQGPHHFPTEIDIRSVGHAVAPKPFVTTGQEYNWRLDTEGIFAALKAAIQSLGREVETPFAVWAATRWIDELIVVRPFPDDLPPHRYVRIVTTAAHGLRWAVDPADLHEPYGGSTTDPPLLRGNEGEAKGLVTQMLIEQALDEADLRNEPVGILLDPETSRHRLYWGRELADVPPETIVFVTHHRENTIIGRR